MRFIIPTLLILLMLAINHAVHGFGCWGLQPGGRTSGYLYLAQLLLSAYAVLYTLTRAVRAASPRNILFASAALGLSVVRWALMDAYGWQMHTSIHNQGAENLLPFFINSAVAIAVGIQILTGPRPEIRLGSDCPECGYPLRQLPEKICPECGCGALHQPHRSTAT